MICFCFCLFSFLSYNSLGCLLCLLGQQRRSLPCLYPLHLWSMLWKAQSKVSLMHKWKMSLLFLFIPNQFLSYLLFCILPVLRLPAATVSLWKLELVPRSYQSDQSDLLSNQLQAKVCRGLTCSPDIPFTSLYMKKKLFIITCIGNYNRVHTTEFLITFLTAVLTTCLFMR